MVTALPSAAVLHERLEGIVDRVTFHNPDNGWSILRVTPFNTLNQETVVVHQTRVFAGATMEFMGSWTVHPRFGRQFQAHVAREKKPATLAALEKYLGSGLIKGVGPKTARKIVRHFKEETLTIFETRMERLTEVPGIAEKKLETIARAWTRHQSIRSVMMFLQTHGISTLFAVRIYKAYGDDAIARVTEDPYRLANDFYGIGFFSADKVALSIGLAPDSPRRIMAGIRHVVSAGRNDGHCYLALTQIQEGVKTLLDLDIRQQLSGLLEQMVRERQLMVRELPGQNSQMESCYYARSLYFDEQYVARRVRSMGAPLPADPHRIMQWIKRFCGTRKMALSPEQESAVCQVVRERFAILTGGPGCGKTTTTRVIVALARAMGLAVTLTAPTGRAAQRMGEVIGQEARTIHRLLEWQGGEFKKNQQQPLACDFLIVDECSMLDISLSASLLKAVPEESRVLFIGDADQLPPVGAGNVLKDIIAAGTVPCFRLTRIFRQAGASMIIQYAHQINRGEMPWITSPFKTPTVWQDGSDCLFMDSDEATGEQLRFIRRVKQLAPDGLKATADSPFEFRINERITPYEMEITIPPKFQHVDIEALTRADNQVSELQAVLKKVHPWSSLHYGFSALEVVKQLYIKWIPRYFTNVGEIQILSPMTRGTLGTANLNQVIQAAANPFSETKPQLTVGSRVFRRGDRVIHRRNNYELGVFNGDIGTIVAMDNSEPSLTVAFYPDGREIRYQQDDILELDLAWAITIHKSQGSEFEVVILPVLTQHYKMLFRNLIYTGLTRARKLAVFVGTRRAMAMAIRNQDVSRRQTALEYLLKQERE